MTVLRTLRAAVLRLLGVFTRTSRDRDYLREIESHFQLHVDDNIKGGMTPDEARRHARVKFGGLESAREAYGDRRGVPVLEQFGQDFRYGVRMLGKHPAFSVVAISTLALGITANTVIFGLANALFLRPAPIASPGQVVRIYSNRHSNTSYSIYREYRDRSTTLDGLALFQLVSLSLRDSASPEHVFGMAVTGNYFGVLGVPASLGRIIAEQDDLPGAAGTVVLTDRMWRTRFNGEAAAIGRSVAINGQPFTIIGVAPPGFDGMLAPLAPEFWVPWNGPGIAPSRPDGSVTTAATRSGHMIGRLRDGAQRGQTQAEFSTLAASIAKARPQANLSGTVAVYPATTLGDEIQGGAAAFVTLLSTIVGLVLLIACVNLATLLLARATARTREIGIRKALGASRSRLVRQLVTENLPVALAGGLLAIALSAVITGAIGAWSPPTPVPISLDVGLDWRVIAFTAAMSLVATIALGLAPALQSSRSGLLIGLREGQSTIAPERSRLRALLMTAQVGMSTILLIAGAVLVRSTISAQAIERGFVSTNVVTASIDLEARGHSRDQGAAFYETLIDRIGAVPGIQATSVIDIIPLTLSNSTTVFLKEGQAPPPPTQPGSVPQIYFTSVTRGHFRTLGIPLRAGRDFTPADRADRQQVAIVNETLARQFWPGENAIGKRMRAWDGRTSFGPWVEVVGLARDSKYVTVGESPKPFMYRPVAQEYVPIGTLLVKTTGDPLLVVPALRAAVQALDPELPLFNVATMDAATSLSLLPVQAAAALSAGLGAVALVLVAIGIYGVVSYVVRQRTREIGIRMALGAQPGGVVRQLAGHGVRLTLTGLVLGLGVSLLLTRLLASLLYGVGPADAISFAAIAILLVVTAFLAAYLPARRAARIDPAQTLRAE